MMSDLGDLLREQFVTINQAIETHVKYAREEFAGKQVNYVARMREILVCDLDEGRDLNITRARRNLRQLLTEIETEARPIYEAARERWLEEKAQIERQTGWQINGDVENED